MDNVYNSFEIETSGEIKSIVKMCLNAHCRVKFMGSESGIRVSKKVNMGGGGGGMVVGVEVKHQEQF